jgi:hypothetical protein
MQPSGSLNTDELRRPPLHWRIAMSFQRHSENHDARELSHEELHSLSAGFPQSGRLGFRSEERAREKKEAFEAEGRENVMITPISVAQGREIEYVVSWGPKNTR